MHDNDASTPAVNHSFNVIFVSQSLEQACESTLFMRETPATDEQRPLRLSVISCVDQAKMWRGGRSKPPGMIPAVSSAGDMTTISVPRMAGVEWNAEGGPATPTQDAVQLLQVEC
jgi:hypothetical protein